MDESQPITLFEPNRFTRESKTHFAAKTRGKENVLINDSAEIFPSLFSKTVTDFEGKKVADVKALANEFRVLQKLQGTGITPEPIAFNLGKDGKKANLLMTKVNGEGLEWGLHGSEKNIGDFSSVIAATARATETIHQRGILIGDVNNGTFLIEPDSDGRSLKSNVVDFEFARDSGDLNSKETSASMLEMYIHYGDTGLNVASFDKAFKLDFNTAKKAELFAAAKAVVVHYLGSDFTWAVDQSKLSEEDRQAYEKQLSQIEPSLETISKSDIAKDYENIKKDAARQNKSPDTTYDNYEKNELPKTLQYNINASMINITLPYLLEEKGIDAHSAAIGYLKEVLSPIIADRPSSVPK